MTRPELVMTIERPFPRSDEIRAYYAGKRQSLELTMQEMAEWFCSYQYTVGRGANHIWLSDEHGNRLAIVTHRKES